MIIYSSNILDILLSHIFELNSKWVSKSWVDNFIPTPILATKMGPNFFQVILEYLQICYGGLREAFITFFREMLAKCLTVSSSCMINLWVSRAMGQGKPKAAVCLLCYFSLKSGSYFPKKLFYFLNESPLKMMKIDFYFVLKALLVHKIFDFLS